MCTSKGKEKKNQPCSHKKACSVRRGYLWGNRGWNGSLWEMHFRYFRFNVQKAGVSCSLTLSLISSFLAGRKVANFLTFSSVFCWCLAKFSSIFHPSLTSSAKVDLQVCWLCALLFARFYWAFTSSLKLSIFLRVLLDMHAQKTSETHLIHIRRHGKGFFILTQSPSLFLWASLLLRFSVTWIRLPLVAWLNARLSKLSLIIS